MHTVRPSRLGAFSFAVAFLLVLASGAEARKFTVTGGTIIYSVPNGLILPLFNPPGAAGTVVQAGGNPAILRIPPGVFDQAPGSAHTIPVATPPQYIQFATQNYISKAPTASALFRAGPKPSRPANFGYCPGVGGPNCSTSNAGSRPGIIGYTAGPNQFGGTMSTLMGGTATVSYVSASTPTYKIAHVPLNLAVANGHAYGFMTNGVGPPGAVTTGGVVNGNGTIYPKGTTVSVIPGFMRTTTGFPFTTGMVVIKIPHNPPTTPDSAFTGTGSDARTPLGAGNITMVAGALGTTTLVGSFGTLETIKLSLAPIGSLFPGIPALAPQGMAALGALLVGAMIVVLRRSRT